jgi:geranylgeranyl pyrophosphate synthase
MPGADEPELDSVGPARFDIRLLSELLKRLAVAECVQWRHRAKPFGLADWYWLAREDTGSMFEICACLGARSQRLRRFGRLLGMLYHGCDDVADVSAAKALGSGEDENADLKDRILTLPAALACARDSEIRELFGDIKRRTKRDKNKLLAAYKRSLPTAEEELDKIAKLAKQEAEANSARPAPLIRLIEYTRKLSRA